MLYFFNSTLHYHTCDSVDVLLVQRYLKFYENDSHLLTLKQCIRTHDTLMYSLFKDGRDLKLIKKEK